MGEEGPYVSERKCESVRVRAQQVITRKVEAPERNACSRTCFDVAMQDLTTLKAEINQEAWETLHSDTSHPFDRPESGRVAGEVIIHLGGEVLKVFGV